MFKKYRKILELNPEKIVSSIGATGQSTIYYLEKSYLENKLFNYLVLLRSEGVDMNDFIDDIIKINYPQYINAIHRIEKKTNHYSENELILKILNIVEPLEKNLNENLGEKISQLEDFQKALVLKFQFDSEIEKTDEEIKLAEQKRKLNLG
ncbi:hypothetical protein [Flavobacterium psychrophilum]|uniref:hypothetical protein n=1 Tax=Flavobacterium psychrophilum TaxID=96345 RepID=UPI00106C9DB1|nr:hypothetical protein [Flavobacterium psychrophilum]